jgi:hypothetical protein
LKEDESAHLMELVELEDGRHEPSGSPRHTDNDSPLNLDNVVEEVYESIDRALQQTEKHKSFKLFIVLYSIFVAPALWSLFGELISSGRKHSIAPSVIPMNPSAVGLCGFVLTVIFLYGSLRVMVGVLGWKQRAKSAAQHKEDLLRIARLSMTLGVVGRCDVHCMRTACFIIPDFCATWFQGRKSGSCARRYHVPPFSVLLHFRLLGSVRGFEEPEHNSHSRYSTFHRTHQVTRPVNNSRPSAMIPSQSACGIRSPSRSPSCRVS